MSLSTVEIVEKVLFFWFFFLFFLGFFINVVWFCGAVLKKFNQIKE